MKTVLFVCHANTCRSVMAHVLLERMLEERRADGAVRVLSGGIGNIARDGMIPSLDARIVLREEGIDLAEDAFASTDLRAHPDIVAAADLVLTMTAAQTQAIRALGAGTGPPVLTLRELAGELGDIADPVGQSEERYRACRDEIKRCLKLSLDRLLVTLSL